MFSNKEYSQEHIAQAGLQAFNNIADKWNLSEYERCSLLGLSSESAAAILQENISSSSLDENVLQRISYLLGIYKALHQLLPSADAANNWVHQVNSAPIFNGNSALNHLVTGDLTDFAALRNYLNAELQ